MLTTTDPTDPSFQAIARLVGVLDEFKGWLQALEHRVAALEQQAASVAQLEPRVDTLEQVAVLVNQNTGHSLQALEGLGRAIDILSDTVQIVADHVTGKFPGLDPERN